MKKGIDSFDIPVRYIGHTYQAKAPNRMQASCTAGEQQAAAALAKKIWGEDFIAVQYIPELSGEKVTIWRATFKVDQA